MKKIIIGLLTLASTSVFATDSCRAKISYSISDALSAEAKDQLQQTAINYLKEESDITVTETNYDYRVILYFRLMQDPHSAKLMPHFELEGSLTGKPDRASEFGVEESLGFMNRRRAASGRVFEKPLHNSLRKFLSSCQALKSASQALGDGTIEMKAGETFTTHTGSVFEAIEHAGFGLSWLAPNGLVWSQALEGEYENLDLDDTIAVDGVIQKSAATEACKAVGGRLPTSAEYDVFVFYFGTRDENRLNKKGLYELNAMFPYQRRGIWTSTAANEEMGSDFAHYVGYTTKNSQRRWKQLVRCVVAN